MATVVDRYSLAAGKGSLVVRRTLYLPNFSTLSIQRTFCCVVALFFGSATKFSVYTTESASNSSPLWNLMRSEEHTSELQSLMRISFAVFCLQKNNIH